jgi:AcrR family transcriptional regulator
MKYEFIIERRVIMELRNEIKKTFIQMVIEDEDVNVSHICHYMNISRKTFYKYFKDKYDLIQKIIYDDIIEYIQYLSQVDGVQVSDAIFVLSIVYTRIYDNRVFYTKLNALKNDENIVLKIFYDEFYKLNLKTFTPLDKKDYELEYQCVISAYAGVHIIEKWMNDGFQLKPHEVAEIFYKYVMRAWIEDIQKYK